MNIVQMSLAFGPRSSATGSSGSNNSRRMIPRSCADPVLAWWTIPHQDRTKTERTKTAPRPRPMIPNGQRCLSMCFPTCLRLPRLSRRSRRPPRRHPRLLPHAFLLQVSRESRRRRTDFPSIPCRPKTWGPRVRRNGIERDLETRAACFRSCTLRL